MQVLMFVLLAACGSSGGGLGNMPSTAVGQGGAQDFGEFRQILEQGGIPGPESIDDVGFFAEHVIGAPPADCGEDVCVTGRLGSMGNMLSGADCTIVLLGFSTPLDVETMARPPMDLTVALDTSTSMAGDSLRGVQRGLSAMLTELGKEDRVSVVTYNDSAVPVAIGLAPDDPELVQAIDGLTAGGGSDMYEGLRVAFDDVLARSAPDRQRRVVLVSDGGASDGIGSDAHVVSLAAAYNAEGLGLSTMALGNADVPLLRDLAVQGGGSAYVLDGRAAVEEVFTDEVTSLLFPLAEDASLRVSLESDWEGRQLYGTTAWTAEDGAFVVDLPVLQVASRSSASDDDLGRRGGGGALVLEVLPTPTSDVGEIGEIAFEYRVPGSEERRAQRVPIDQDVRPGDTGFTDAATEKAFVMLNIYVGFEMATELAADARPATALQVLTGLRTGVSDWLVTNPDEDIADDLIYIDLFVENLLAAGGVEGDIPQVPEPWPAD